MFERFTRADASRVRAAGAAEGKSTGLGLAIVSAVVEAHRGTVGVVSQPGRTEFTVRLPLAETARHVGPLRTWARHAAGRDPSTCGPLP